MAHLRTQIRNALVALLTDLPTTADRVFPGQIYPLGPEQLPALLVHVDDEEIEALTIHGPAQLSRTVTIRVECVTQLSEGLEDEMDEMALEVEHAVASDASLGGLLNSVLVPNGIETERSGDGDAPMGRLTVRYLAEYLVSNDAVDTPL